MVDQLAIIQAAIQSGAKKSAWRVLKPLFETACGDI